MKVLHISTYDNGGAAKACIRLHEGLLKNNIESKILFFDKTFTEVEHSHSFYKYYYQQENYKYHNASSIAKVLDKIKYKFGIGERAAFDKILTFRNKLLEKKTNSSLFSFPQSAYKIHEHPLYKEADIVNLHWVSFFLDYPTFFCNHSKKLVWTLHDMNPFTGGCHYSSNCHKYEDNCDVCFQLQETSCPDYSATTLQIKVRSLSSISNNLTIVSPSNWLKKAAAKSSLFKSFQHYHIPYGIDSEVFTIRDQAVSRALLDIPDKKPVILFVASTLHDTRKGFTYLLEALSKLDIECTLCVIGGGKDFKIDQHRHTIVRLNTIYDERLLSMAYSAADAFVIPSLEDNLPNTVLESLLCGTPVIGFSVGGITEMIQHQENGLLCEEITSDSLAKAINKFLANPELFNRKNIRITSVHKYDSAVQARAYINLYNDILK